MKKFQEKQIIKSRLYSPITIIFLFIVLLFAVNGSKNIWLKYFESKENATQTYRKLEELEARKKGLEEQTERLKSEEGIEEEVREKFNVLRPGEKVLVIKEEESEQKEEETFWQKFKAKFGFE